MNTIGILGSGEVGQTLAQGFKKHGYEVRIGSRTPAKLAAFAQSVGITAGTFAEVASWGQTLVLTVSGDAAQDVVRLAGPDNLSGKTVIDTTNPLSHKPPVDGVLEVFTGPNTSLLEQVQDAFPEVHFVKAFNSAGSSRMVNPSFAGGPPTMFYCGNDSGAKAEVATILGQFGWEGLDMGSARAARAIEPLAQLWCIVGFRQNIWNHAFKVLWS